MLFVPACAAQNRDTWAMPTVQDIIRQHFVFWQQYVSTPQGQTFVNFYQVETKPVVMILDAETKTKLKEWTGFVEPDLLVDNVTAFVGTAGQPVVTCPVRQIPADLVRARGRRGAGDCHQAEETAD